MKCNKSNAPIIYLLQAVVLKMVKAMVLQAAKISKWGILWQGCMTRMHAMQSKQFDCIINPGNHLLLTTIIMHSFRCGDATKVKLIQGGNPEVTIPSAFNLSALSWVDLSSSEVVIINEER